MTASLLLLYIFAALAAQVAIGIGVAAWRSRHAAPPLPAPPSQDRPSTAAWPGWRQFRVDRRVYEDRDRSQCSFHLKPVDGLALPPFDPGQFLTVGLKLDGAMAGGSDPGRLVVRCYSLSDRPTAESYRLTIKRVPAPVGRPELPPGIASSHFHDNVAIGDIIDVKAPAGQFRLPPDDFIPAVLIAGGVGVTPMMSMLRWCLAEQPGRAVHLYYGVRRGGEHAFKAALSEVSASCPSFHPIVAYSDPGPDDLEGRDFQHAGRIDLELLRGTLPAGRHRFFVCGPPSMMASLLPGLRDWGVAEEDIHFEAFGSASVRSTVAGSPGAAGVSSEEFEVAFTRSGRTLTWDGRDENLLDFAERHGIAIDSGCRSGSCGSCETKIISGGVRYAHKPDHEIADGCCLLCVGAPVSALRLKA